MNETTPQKLMIELSLADVEYEVECLPESMQIEGNAMVSGDDEEDRKCEQWIHDQLESGNDWAWCCIKVTARLGPFEGFDCLGGCSYLSEADFMTEDGYYPGMRDVALADLLEHAKAQGAKLVP